MVNKKYENIFITGATGFLGRYLVLLFLLETDAHLYCLVRNSQEENPKQRMIRLLTGSLSNYLNRRDRISQIPAMIEDRVTLLEGDVKLPGLGIQENLSRLKTITFDALWHLAARVDFSEHRAQETLETNIGGTKNILVFMRKYNIPLINFVSTAYTAGSKTGKIAEEKVDESFPVNNPYEESKRLCEAEILTEYKERGTGFRILRPSILVGHSETLSPESPYGIYGFFTGLIRFKEEIEDKLPDYFKHNDLKMLMKFDALLNLISVDHAAEIMFKIGQNKKAVNDYFQVVNPFPVSVDKYFKVVTEELGITIARALNIEELNPIDFLFHTQTDIYNCYLENIQEFTFNKAEQASEMSFDKLSLNKTQQEQLIRKYFYYHKERKDKKKKKMISAVRNLARNSIPISEQELLSYYVGGKNKDNEVLVIINAYGQSFSFWNWIISHFYEKYKVIIWQARGTTSQWGGLDQFHNVMTHVNDLYLILKNENVSKCNVLGWCTGPKLAMAFHAEYPGIISSMVFIAGAFKGLPCVDHYQTKYEINMEPICKLVDEHPGSARSLLNSLKSIIVGKSAEECSLTIDDPDSHQRIAEILSLVSRRIKTLVLEPFLNKNSIVNYARQLLDFWGHDVSHILPTIDRPVLFISGEYDNIASPQASKEVSKLVPGSKYLEIRGGSHYVHYENHELLIDIIEKFLKEKREFSFNDSRVIMEK